MKTTIIVLSVITLMSIFGMFYWMYKARKGELDLQSTSWHYKLKHWMWDFETYEGRNACPYYWGLVFSIIILPIYCISRLVFEIYEFINKKLPKSKLNIKLPTIIPPTKKEMYSNIYRNAKDWLSITLVIIGMLFFLYTIFKCYYNLFLFNINYFFIALFIVLVFIFSVLQNAIKPELNKYWITPLNNLYNSIFSLIKLPFIIVYNIIKWPVVKIFKIVEDNCPPIVWDRK